MRYENPVHWFDIGDVVRIGNGSTEWTVDGKGATTGLALKNKSGRKRIAHTFEVTLVHSRSLGCN
jgi:hypothetical protein